jgi:hypothetical protein
MVVANCARSLSLAVNKTAVNVAMLSKDHAKNLNLVPFTAVPLTKRNYLNRLMAVDKCVRFISLAFNGGSSDNFVFTQHRD